MDNDKKIKNTYILSIVLLSLLLIISLILGFSGWLSNRVFFNIESSLELGELAELEINKNSLESISFLIDGSVVPNQDIKQMINLSYEGAGAQAVRVKPSISRQSGGIVLNTSNHFVIGDDGYYYFDTSVISGEKISICSSIKLTNNAELESTSKYIVNITVETIDYSAMPTLWENNPNLA